MLTIVGIPMTYLADQELTLSKDVCLLTLSFGIAQWAMMYRRVARHAWDIPLTSINPQVYQVWAAHTVLGIISFFNTKALILTFYLRLFGTVRWVRWMCYSLLSLSVVIYGMIGLWYVAGCVPKNSKLPVCDETGPLILAGGVFTVVADVMLFGMPFPVIRGLRLGRDKKRGLVVLFGFAILIIATSTVSLAYRISIVVNGTEDPSWDGAEVAVTAYVEGLLFNW
ncbi:Putative protein of unknown function [Podospora comata]|uniref:Rhodopsin domain-containing protein n=1 Tax=Podospora comata TaxID=48703 RepID=A0ABY6SH59_PODCO|nr:Putative protein of unknown function [Podospora comata]